MTDLPPSRDSNGDSGDGALMSPGREATSGAPHWVKVFGIVALVLVLLFVILHFTGRGLGCHKPSSNVTEDAAQQQ